MYNFDVKKETENLVKWIRQWFKRNAPHGKAVIGISGGKDSSVAAAACVAALGSSRVIGLMLPDGEQHDKYFAEALAKDLGITTFEANIESCREALQDEFIFTPNSVAKTNLPARLRTVFIMYLAQCMDGVMVNTCNLSEDWVGYSTLFGDNLGSLAPLRFLTVQEVLAVGKELGLDDTHINKVPSDGLCGKTDEDNLGFTYKTLDNYIRTGEIEDQKVKEIIDRKHKANLFKLKIVDIDGYKPDVEIAIANDIVLK